MKRSLFVVLVAVLSLSAVLPVYAEVTVTVTVDDNLFVTFEFKDLNQTVYEQVKAQFTADRIPKIIEANLQAANQSVQWGLPAEPLVFDDASRTMRCSFFLSGSDIVSYRVNATNLKREYEVKLAWRKFTVDVAPGFTIDFGARLATPVEEWQKPIANTFQFESKQSGEVDVVFSIVLPAAASDVRAVGDTVFYSGSVSFEDQFLYSPFPVLLALAVILGLVLLYRKVR